MKPSEETKLCKNCGDLFVFWLESEKVCPRCKAIWGDTRKAPPRHGLITKKKVSDADE